MDKDNDVVKIDFPEYEESSFPFPDVKTDGSFAENKDEIFRRNMIIAAKEAREAKLPGQRIKLPENFGTKEIFPQDIFRKEKRSGHESLFKKAARILDHSHGLKIIYSLFLAALVVIMTVLLSLTFRIRGGRVTNRALDIKLEAETIMTVQYEEFEDLVPDVKILEEQATEVLPEEISITITEISVLD